MERTKFILDEKNMPKATFEAQIRMLRAVEWLEVTPLVEKEMKSAEEKKKIPSKKVK